MIFISTRGRYALRVLAELAEAAPGEFLAVKEIAQRQGISPKYLERILPALAKNGIVEGRSGKYGGYRLAVSPRDVSVLEVLLLTEKTLAPVACLAKGAKACARASNCRTLGMWKELDALILDYLKGRTLGDLLDGPGTGPQFAGNTVMKLGEEPGSGSQIAD